MFRIYPYVSCYLRSAANLDDSVDPTHPEHLHVFRKQNVLVVVRGQASASCKRQKQSIFVANFSAFAGVCLTNLCKATLECWFLLRKRTCKIPKVPDNFDSTEAMLPRQPPASSDVTPDLNFDVTHIVHKPGNRTSSLLLSETCVSTL